MAMIIYNNIIKYNLKHNIYLCIVFNYLYGSKQYLKINI